MSSKPPKNLPSVDSRPGSPVAGKKPEDVESTASSKNEDSISAEEDEEEFTLEHLSAAYAKVVITEPDGIVSSTDESLQDVITKSADPSTDVFLRDQDDLDDPDEADNEACPISPESIIESILFVGTPRDVKLTSRKIAAVLRDVSPMEVTEIVKKLNSQYESENAAFRIVNEGGALKMALVDSLKRLQQDFFGRNRRIKLSQAAINVMAVVAYNQPATKEQVEKIRAKPSGSILSQLVKRNLLFVEPTENYPDKKLRYSTTDKFLDFFNLEEIADLPQSHEVSDIDELAD